MAGGGNIDCQASDPVASPIEERGMSNLRKPARMCRRILLRALAAALIATGAHIATAAPGFAQVPCLPHQQLVEMLDARYSEHRIGAGLENGGAMFEVFATADGSTWTMVVTTPNGASCVIAVGMEWQSPETEQPKSET
jgi:hypothetical protein